jgi:hypothetical protein
MSWVPARRRAARNRVRIMVSAAALAIALYGWLTVGQMLRILYER